MLCVQPFPILYVSLCRRAAASSPFNEPSLKYLATVFRPRPCFCYAPSRRPAPAAASTSRNPSAPVSKYPHTSRPLGLRPTQHSCWGSAGCRDGNGQRRIWPKANNRPVVKKCSAFPPDAIRLFQNPACCRRPSRRTSHERNAHAAGHECWLWGECP